MFWTDSRGQAKLRLMSTLLAVLMMGAVLFTLVEPHPNLPTPPTAGNSDNDEFFDLPQDDPKENLAKAKAAYIGAKVSYKLSDSNLPPEQLQQALANLSRAKVAWKEAALKFAVYVDREEEIEKAKDELDDAKLKLLNHDKPWYSRWIRNNPKTNLFGAFLLGGAVMWFAKEPIRNLWHQTPPPFADPDFTFPPLPSTVKAQPVEGMSVWWALVIVVVVAISVLTFVNFVFGSNEDEHDYYYYQEYERDRGQRRPRRPGRPGRDGHSHRRDDERGHKRRRH